MIIDIHTHHPAPRSQAVVCVDDVEGAVNLFEGFPEQLFSVGVHPWNSDSGQTDMLMENVKQLVSSPQVAAIGETGIDTLKGAPLFVQLNLLRQHVSLSEQMAKPLILHSVRGSDIIMGLHRDLKPQQKWCIHGFRGKPQEAEMLARKGIYLGFGEKFNPDTLKFMIEKFPGQVLAETDESRLAINEIIARLSETAATDLLPLLTDNTSRFLEP